MAFKVPYGTSAPGLPATVTVPDVVGCLYCRWPPLVLARYHPLSSSSLSNPLALISDPSGYFLLVTCGMCDLSPFFGISAHVRQNHLAACLDYF